MKSELEELKQSDFEDDKSFNDFAICFHPGHKPPTHLVIPAGRVYRHVCPACGREIILRQGCVFM